MCLRFSLVAGHLNIFAPNDAAMLGATKEVGIELEDFFAANDPAIGLQFLTKLISFQSCENQTEILSIDSSSIKCSGKHVDLRQK